MTNELNDLVPAQEKLEWVTPKISLMVAEDTEGKNVNFKGEIFRLNTGFAGTITGPS